MQITSETYKTLIAKGTNVTSKEVRATIGLDNYYQDQLVEVKTTSALMTGDTLIGNCIASTLDIKIRNPNTIPRMAQINVEVRLDDGETQSEWLPKGTYFIDTRAIEDDVLHIVAYDAMLKTEQSFTQAGDQGEWPRTDITVVNQIAQRIGVSVDARTTAMLNKGYLVQYPGIVLETGTPKYSADGAYTMREVLGFIGGLYAGNWIITDENNLRLIGLGDIPAETYYLIEEHGDAILIGGVKILV